MRGAWHCHVLLRFNSLDKVYIPNADIAKIWGQGFVSVKAMKKDTPDKRIKREITFLDYLDALSYTVHKQYD